MEVDIEKAVDEGVLTAEQGQRLANFVVRTDRQQPYDEDEKIGIIKGFNDVFLSIGICLLVAGVIGSSWLLYDKNDYIVSAAFIVLGWGIAEALKVTYRAVLPFILTTISVALGAYGLFGQTFLYDKDVERYFFVSFGFGSEIWAYFAGISFATLPLIPICLFYRRFRVPFALLILYMSLVGSGLAFVLIATFGNLDASLDFVGNTARVYFGIAGLAVFGAAMKYDMSDTNRITRRSDCAFWLHALAAGLVIHSAMSPFFNQTDIVSLTILTGGLLFVLILSLAIDRRSPIVTTMIYVASSYYAYVDDVMKIDTDLLTAITIATMGGFILLVGLFWHQIRYFLFNPFRYNAVLRKLPPIT